MSKLNKYLVLLRKFRGYTQAQMAEKLKIPRSTYTNYETGNRSPDLDTLERISDVLECSIDELFGRVAVNQMPKVCDPKTTYHVNEAKSQKYKQKKLAIGMQDFRSLREKNGYYVDKTPMIEAFIETGYQVTLITRPRRFGKTLNMSMLAEFFDCTKNSGDIFTGTRIVESYVVQEMNEYPVVFLSFLNVKGDTEEEMLTQMMFAIRSEYDRYYNLVNDGTLGEIQTESFNWTYNVFRQPKDVEDRKNAVQQSITILCRTLEAYFQKKVYLFLDEYDTPFMAANNGGYYEKIRSTLVGMLSSALKGNPSLEKAVLTGIQRVAKENIFSGLNNLIVCTVKDAEYAEYFGFTELETRALLQYYGIEFSDDIKAMYDGYLFGMVEVYNPWSVTFFASRKKLDSYWVNTSKNSIIKQALEQSNDTFSDEYNQLIQEGTVCAQAELETAYYEDINSATLWGFLINAGMVTIQEELEEDFYQLRIPNNEVRKAFQNLTAFYLQVGEHAVAKMLRCLRMEMMDEFVRQYQRILLTLPSYHDLKDENSYHMMMLGMCAFMYPYYDVINNRESGIGREDILLRAKKSGATHMILEFKYTKDEKENLEKLAQSAVTQIKGKQYDAELNGSVYYIGLAHFGKTAEVKWEKKNRKG